MQQKAVLEGRIRKFNEEAEVARWVGRGVERCACGMHVLAACVACICLRCLRDALEAHALAPGCTLRG